MQATSFAGYDHPGIFMLGIGLHLLKYTMTTNCALFEQDGVLILC